MTSVDKIFSPEAFFAPNSTFSTRQGLFTNAKRFFYGTSPGEVKGLKELIVLNSHIENTLVQQSFNGGQRLMRTVRLENGEEITGTDELRLLTVVPLEEEGQYDMVLKELQDIVPGEDLIVYNPDRNDEGQLTFSAFPCSANIPRGLEECYAIVHETPEDNSFIINKMIVNIPV